MEAKLVGGTGCGCLEAMRPRANGMQKTDDKKKGHRIAPGPYKCEG